MRLAMMMAMQAVAGPPLPADMRPVKPAPAPDAPKAACGDHFLRTGAFTTYNRYK